MRLDREKFDLAANVPAGATKAQFRMMMQNLLAERFRLRLHTQSKEFPAYELVVAKTGPKLTVSNTGGMDTLPREAKSRLSPTNDGFPELLTDRPDIAARHSMDGGVELVHLKAHQETLSALAQWLSSDAGRPIVDRSRLTARYDFSLEFTKELPEAMAEMPHSAPSLFTALRQQLGLQLVSSKVPFDVLTIDRVDTAPTEN